MRIVADTNVLVSALGWKGGAEYRVVQKCVKNELELVITAEILAEFKNVALRPKFKFTTADIEDFTAALLETSVMVLPGESLTIIEEDPKDDMFLEAAIAGNASHIISGDRHLLDLGTFRGIRILRAPAFLEIIISAGLPRNGGSIHSKDKI